MALSGADRELIVDELDRELTVAETALFENLWSEHCAYRSSRALLRHFTTEGDDVVIGPGDDAGVVALTDDLYLACGIESHNHPSYVDPYDGAATGVGGIVRDVISMGAYPIALADSLYFGGFEREHSLYLFEGVVEGIADYGNAIGVPTVAGSVQFHDGYVGNPLVNVACVGLVPADRLLTAATTTPGHHLVLIGNATGRDGLGGASFASEDLSADAETEDRPAVQVGDPYTEKLLIEANEALLDAGVVQAARDLGAAGLGGATSEMVAKGGHGAEIDLGAVHQREPNMTAMEILLAESQERMCYEVASGDLEAVRSIAERYELGCSVIGTVTESGRYECHFQGETVVDVPLGILVDGAPEHDLPSEPPEQRPLDIPDFGLAEALEAVLGHPNTAEKDWIYRQYDHEVGIRTALRPGDDAAVLAIREADIGLAFSAGGDANWTSADPYTGAGAIAVEVATDIAAKAASPVAAVDCLNGGNPETPSVYHGFSHVVRGLADMCERLEVPIIGGNVSLYNDSPSGPIPPTPTLAMIGTTPTYDPPTRSLTGDGSVLLIGPHSTRLGGSQLLASLGGTDAFPELPERPRALIEAIQQVARSADTLATHSVSHGGLAVALAEMISEDVGISIDTGGPVEALFSERPGRVIVETSDPAAVEDAVGALTPVSRLGFPTSDGRVTLECSDGQVSYPFEDIETRRGVIRRTLD